MDIKTIRKELKTLGIKTYSSKKTKLSYVKRSDVKKVLAACEGYEAKAAQNPAVMQLIRSIANLIGNKRYLRDLEEMLGKTVSSGQDEETLRMLARDINDRGRNEHKKFYRSTPFGH